METVLKEVKGIFDGVNMVARDGFTVRVPENYASKSLILTGTEMVYRVTDQGAYFKQLKTPIFKHGMGVAILNPEGDLRIRIEDEGIIYDCRVLNAYVTFFNIQPGDELVVRVPEDLKILSNNWCVVENKVGSPRSNY